MKNNRTTVFKSTLIIRKALRFSINSKSTSSKLISAIGLGTAFFPLAISKTLEAFSNNAVKQYYGEVPLRSGVIILGILIFLYFIQDFYSHIQEYFYRKDVLETQKNIKKVLIENALSVKYELVSDSGEYAKKYAIATKASLDQAAKCMQSTVEWGRYLLTIFTLFFSIAAINIYIAMAIVLSTIPSAFLTYKQNGESFSFDSDTTKLGQLLTNSYTEMVGPKEMLTVRYFGIVGRLKQQWKKTAQLYISQKHSIIKKFVKRNSLASLAQNGVFLLVIFVAARKVYLAPQNGLGDFILIFSLAEQLQTNISSFAISVLNFGQNTRYLKDLFETGELNQKDKESTENNSTNTEECKASAIEFKNVSFSYPGKTSSVLKNINLHISPGEHVAIVGENGSGKTTLINLLCGLYEPTHGAIYIDNEATIHREKYIRKKISIVFQDYIKYEASLKDNITISHEDPSTTTKLSNICQLYGIDKIIAKLPNGINTRVGSLGNLGSNLSEGEWQKVAIARALFKQNTSIMVLDEPTASLDPKSEAQIYSEFTGVMNPRTVILITHRLGAIKFVDRIIVLKNGEVVEDGSHESLLNMHGEYARMYSAQAKWYQ